MLGPFRHWLDVPTVDQRQKKKSRDNSTGFEREFSNFISTLWYLSTLGILCFVIFILLALFRIESFAFHTYNNVNEIPYNEVGLILGTSSLTSDGTRNPFFVNRIRAATLLYRKGKIDYILVSGDNRHASYNEPRQMMNALLKEGIPRDRIIADFAGFSTLDSIARASRVFMLRNVTVISQEFHNTRALFIAERESMNAIGFNARDPSSKWGHAGVYIREIFARLKCILDVYFLNTQPTFLGEPIQIGSSPLPKQPSNKPKHATSQPKQITDSAFAQHNPHLNLHIPPKEQTDAAIILKQKHIAQHHLEQAVQRDQNRTPQNNTTAPAAPSRP